MVMGSLSDESGLVSRSLRDICTNNMEKFLRERLLDPTQPISERFRALFSLRNLKGSAPRDALVLATRDRSNLLAHEAAFALGQMQDAEAIPALEAVLNDLSLHPIVRHEAAEALGAIGLKSNIPLLKNSLVQDPAQEVRETCELALKRIEELSVVAPDYEATMTEKSPFMSVDPAAPTSSCSSVEKLREVLLDEEKGMYERYAALFALRNYGGEEAISAIIDSLEANSALLRHEVAYVLGQLQNRAASDALSEILRNVKEHPMVRHEAAEALGSIADEESIALLEEFARDPEPLVSQSCEVALSMLEFERHGKSFEMWHHGNCILKKAKQIKSIDDVEGLESLRWEDQQKIRKYVEGGGTTNNDDSVTRMEFSIEVSQTSRATCRCCNQKIMKGAVRISSKPDGQGAKGLAWHHANCFMEASPSVQVEELSGWQSLPVSDQATVLALVKKIPSVKGGAKTEVKRGKELDQSASKTGIKRRRDNSEDQKSKIVKTEDDVSTSRARAKRIVSSAEGHTKVSNLESKLEAQSKELWALKDLLKEHVTTAELREMLEMNGQDSTGSELDLRDRCADGMMFGAPGRCPICSGSLRYSGGMYRCHGHLSEWSKCSYSTCEPERMKGKWKIAVEKNNQFLSKWFKSQKGEKPVRIMLPASSKPSASGAANSTSQSSQSENLGDLSVSISGVPKELIEEWKRKIEEAGGQFHSKIKKGINCLVVSGELDNQDAEFRKARRMKIPVVRENYLVDCFKRQKKLPFELYKVEATGEASSMVTVKVKGHSAVHEASGLQDSGHILEDGRSIYNTTLSLSDLSTGVNSYYILQIIKEDKGTECYVYRKWGRVGNEKIGGDKLENMSKSDAIKEFKRLFLEKTGNPWEAWEDKKKFKKQPGRFFPLDIDYGVTKQATKNRQVDADSQLASSLIELMKMLFNVEAYRAAMMEFDINMLEMPLGKLSKHNIQKGFEALTEIQNLLNNNTHDPSIKESLIVDASNRFFTLIPSIHPHVIRDEDEFKSKVKMLEALQDIEIASRLVGFDVDSDDSLDEKYKKLRCDITPLPHNSEDYRLIEKYLSTTHAPTHTDWTLELEEVFSLEREGELDKFAPYREKLGNRILLWHGSRLTNFVGILSQGLRIAPPEAPATGYMFGKGVYFADLVSKSAQYCYTDKKSPVGLLLLSEVALGEVYELKAAKYMEKPPKGKHSTKGLGKKVPQESEFVRWRDDVVLPCGKPVTSNVKASELMYNEYIVYDTAQVKMQFLLKVRFHHKR